MVRRIRRGRHLDRFVPVAIGLLVLASALAGCIGGGGGPKTTPSTTPSPTTTSTTTTTAPPSAPPPVIDLLLGFALTDCAGIAVQHARPLEDIQALLPDGFAAAPAPGSADPRGVVTVLLYACGNFTVADTVVPDTYFGAVSTFIARPDERVPGAPQTEVQEYLFRVLAGEDVLAVLWRAAGYDTYNASASVAVTGAGLPFDPGARTGSADLGDYQVLADGGQVPGLPGPITGPFTRYSALGDGSVLVWTGTYDLGAAAIGSGVARLAGDDPVASLGLGPGRPAVSGTAQLHDAGAFLAQDLRRVFTSVAA